MLQLKKETNIAIEHTEDSTKIKITVQSLCYVFLIFLLGSFVGWIYEEIFYWITEGMLRNRGVLYGPWLPIYGIGALGIYTLKPLKKHPILLFLLCIAITGVVEYIIGFIGIRFFGLRLWDYNGLFLNISGIVCFRSVVSFAILGIVFHYLIEPMEKKLYLKIPVKKIRIACLVILVIFIIDCILSILFRTPITY